MATAPAYATTWDQKQVPSHEVFEARKARANIQVFYIVTIMLIFTTCNYSKLTQSKWITR